MAVADDVCGQSMQDVRTMHQQLSGSGAIPSSISSRVLSSRTNGTHGAWNARAATRRDMMGTWTLQLYALDSSAQIHLYVAEFSLVVSVLVSLGIFFTEPLENPSFSPEKP